jgi:protease IV
MRPYIPPSVLEAMGISVGQITFSEGSKTQSLFNDLEGEHWERYKAHIHSIYDVFKQRVSDGRKMSLDTVEQVAGGRVWTGSEALSHGLVDQMGMYSCFFLLCILNILLGGLKAAIQMAADQVPPTSELEPVVDIVVYPRQKTWVQRLVEAESAEDVIDVVQTSVSEGVTIVGQMVLDSIVMRGSPADASLSVDDGIVQAAVYGGRSN